MSVKGVYRGLVKPLERPLPPSPPPPPKEKAYPISQKIKIESQLWAERMTGPAEPVRPLRPWSDQKSCHLWSKPCDFSFQIGPIIVRLRFFSNGRTNLDLFPLLLNEAVSHLFCHCTLSQKLRLG